MAIQLYIGYIGEGSTDKRFLPEIILNTFANIAFDCHNEIDITPIIHVPKGIGSFVDAMTEAAKYSSENGISILCIHADADKKSLSDVLANKFEPLYKKLQELNEREYCKNIVAVIPITETESWMLADKELLKDQIGAKYKSDVELGIDKHPESYGDPKKTIEDAIKIAQQNKTKRRRHDLSITDLYGELGQSIKIDVLKKLTSYCYFEENIRESFIRLGYLHS